MVVMTTDIMLNFGGDVVGIPEYDEILNFLEETGVMGGIMSITLLFPIASIRWFALRRP